MKRLTAILLLAALLCGCARTDGAPAETTAEVTTAAETAAAPETEAEFVPSVGTIKMADLPNWGLDDVRSILYDYDPATDTGIAWVWHDKALSITRYAVQGLDWIYGAKLSADDVTLLDDCYICPVWSQGNRRIGFGSYNDLFISRQRTYLFDKYQDLLSFIPRAELTVGENCIFLAQPSGDGTCAVWGGAESQLADRIMYSAAALRLVWDYAYATRTVPLGGLEAVYRRLPSAEAEQADISHGDGLYRKDSTTLWRFSHYAGTGYTLDDLLARYGVVSAAELASVSYTGPSESVGAIAPRESDAPAEIETLLALLRQSEVPRNPVYAEYVFPGEASAAYTAGKHASYFWRDIALTTKEGETLILSHFPTESMLVWQGETILALPEETNRALMQYSFFMNETEVWAFYDAMEAFLATQGRGQSPGTTAVTTAPPGTMSDWMYTPLPGTTPIG